MTYGGPDYVEMIQKENKKTCIFFFTCPGGEDNQGLGKVFGDSLLTAVDLPPPPSGGKMSRGQDIQGHRRGVVDKPVALYPGAFGFILRSASLSAAPSLWTLNRATAGGASLGAP